jgi:hypothetical protein
MTSWGVGYSSYAVATGNTVNHNDFNALVSDINVCYQHIYGTNSSISTVAQGTRISQAYLTNASAAVSNIVTNRYAATSSIRTQVTFYDSGNVPVGPFNSYWTVQWTVNWGSSSAYQLFWNNGGYFEFATGGGGGSNGQSVEIGKLFQNMGVLVMTANSCYQSGQTWTGTIYFQGALNAASGGSTWLYLSNPDSSYTADYMTVAYTPNGTFTSASSAVVTLAVYNGRTTLGGAPNTILTSGEGVFYLNYVNGHSLSSITLTSQTTV